MITDNEQELIVDGDPPRPAQTPPPPIRRIRVDREPRVAPVAGRPPARRGRDGSRRTAPRRRDRRAVRADPSA